MHGHSIILSIIEGLMPRHFSRPVWMSGHGTSGIVVSYPDIPVPLRGCLGVRLNMVVSYPDIQVALYGCLGMRLVLL